MGGKSNMYFVICYEQRRENMKQWVVPRRLASF